MSAGECTVADVRRGLLTLLQYHTQIHEVPLNQIVLAQLKMLQLIEGLDRKVALLATSKK